ncbi:BspA family leucine-rich repeat surface protein [Campylobacter jejuni]|nr:BspA family leucine-rich repeat surface protein [Campylobacter jejuni]
MQTYKAKNNKDLKLIVDNEEINLGVIDVSEVIDFSGVFKNSTRTDFSGIEKWDVSNATNMRAMFENCTSFNQDISGWDVSGVYDFSSMFKGCENFNQDISKWNTMSAYDMDYMFYKCEEFDQDLSSWNINKVKHTQEIFKSCKIKSQHQLQIKHNIPETKAELILLIRNFDISLKDIDTSNITDMSELFKNSLRRDFVGIETWNVSNVKTMRSMFQGCQEFDRDISNWDVSRVTNMAHMFDDCTSFNQDISKWDVSRVTNMAGMFQGATSFNQPLNSWELGSLLNASSMFKNTINFNQPLGDWDVSGVEDMYEMFQGATSFNQDISGWDLKSIALKNYMFKSCPIENNYRPLENDTGENQINKNKISFLFFKLTSIFQKKSSLTKMK